MPQYFLSFNTLIGIIIFKLITSFIQYLNSSQGGIILYKQLSISDFKFVSGVLIKHF